MILSQLCGLQQGDTQRQLTSTGYFVLTWPTKLTGCTVKSPDMNLHGSSRSLLHWWDQVKVGILECENSHSKCILSLFFIAFWQLSESWNSAVVLKVPPTGVCKSKASPVWTMHTCVLFYHKHPFWQLKVQLFHPCGALKKWGKCTHHNTVLSWESNLNW